MVILKTTMIFNKVEISGGFKTKIRDIGDDLKKDF